MPRQPLEAYYDQPELWDAARYAENPQHGLRARLIASLLEPSLDVVVDMGCGNGFITRHLTARLVVGLDPSMEALRHFNGNAVAATGERLPFRDRSIDCVVCSEVLEHLNAPSFRATVQELARVTKSSLIIAVPYREDLRHRTTVCGRCGTRYHTWLHQRSFRGPEDLKRAFPGSVIVASVLAGSRTMIRSRLFRHLRHILVGRGEHSTFARCPRCGFGGASPPAWPRRQARRLFDALAWRMPKESVPRWMIVLLKRDGDRVNGLQENA